MKKPKVDQAETQICSWRVHYQERWWEKTDINSEYVTEYMAL